MNSTKDLTPGWLLRQLEAASKEYETWSDSKKESMKLNKRKREC